MEGLLERFDELDSLAAELVEAVVRPHGMRGGSEADIAAALIIAARVQRRLDAVLLEAVGEVVHRSGSGDRDDRMTTRAGCRDVNELVQRLTRVSAASAARWLRAARATDEPVSLMTGKPLPAALPQIRAALLEGEIGIDGVLAVAGPVLDAAQRVPRDSILAADAALAAEARGEGADGAPACADMLRLRAQAWAIVLDPDGAEPRERETIRKRGVTLGRPVAAGVPISGMLMPEVGAQLQRIFDAALSPKVDGVRFDDPSVVADGIPVDTRTRIQKQHDAFAIALSVAASSRLLPTIGGAAPTLVVSVRAEDLESGRGHAFAEGCETPLTVAAAEHAGCAGVIQRVALSSEGRITAIGTEERVFNRHQRRAIALRDGGCLIPGCRVPAGWCEIHHVTEHVRGGPTHTDNGVLLCWFHHRFLDRSGWAIRMNRGVPEVRAPGWCDAALRWRPATTSLTRMSDVIRRT